MTVSTMTFSSEELEDIIEYMLRKQKESVTSEERWLMDQRTQIVAARARRRKANDDVIRAEEEFRKREKDRVLASLIFP